MEKIKTEWNEVKKEREKLVEFIVAILVMEGYTPEMANQILSGQEWEEEMTLEGGSTLEDVCENEWDREEWIINKHGQEIYEEYKRKKIIKGLSNDEMTEYESEEILRDISQEIAEDIAKRVSEGTFGKRGKGKGKEKENYESTKIGSEWEDSWGDLDPRKRDEYKTDDEGEEKISNTELEINIKRPQNTPSLTSVRNSRTSSRISENSSRNSIGNTTQMAKIAKFNEFGGTNEEDVNEWIADLDRKFPANGILDADRVSVVAAKLVGIAAEWYDGLTGKDALTYDEDNDTGLLKKLRKRFLSKERAVIGLQELGNLIQGTGETIDQYVRRYSKIAKR